MVETYQFGLPLMQAAQAQKHVTVNEALARLDAMAQLRVVSSALTTPPGGAVDGAAYVVAGGGSGDWAGHGGEIAIWVNGGWAFISPKLGWRLWDEAAGVTAMFDGQGWVRDTVALSPGGAATQQRVVEIDHLLSAGASSTVVGAIPPFAQVTGVTGRVLQAVTGTLTGWRLGVLGAEDRYGSGLGLGVNSYVLGVSGTPVTYYGATDLLLTSEAGDFAGGEIRLAIHVTMLRPPVAV
ncbi:DUF2793 domain-containing protein [Halovulum sp. GXIMD14793]